MKKILSIFVLSFFLSTQTASAFAPLAIPAWYYGAGALALGGGAGVYCAMKTGYVATVDVAGDLRRKAGVAWVALKTVSVPVLYTKDVTAKKTFNQLLSVIRSKPETYPNLHAKSLTSLGPFTFNPSTAVSSDYANLTANRDYYTNGTYSYLVTSISINNTTMGLDYGSVYHDNGYPVFRADGTFSDRVYVKITGLQYKLYTINGSKVATPVSPTYRDATPAEFQSNIIVSPSDTSAASPYQSELDKMMQDDTYVPTFTDDTTGLPFVYPPNPMSPAALTSYNAQGVAAEERERALAAAQQAAASAISARDVAVSNANANPTDSALAQKAADATAAAASATATAQKIAADNSTTTAHEASKAAEQEADESFSSVDVPALKSFSWARLADLRGLLATTFPFSLLSSMSEILGTFVRDPVAPSFTLPMYGGNQLTFSLDIFDGIATFFRWAFASIMTIGIVHRIVVFYRGA